MSLRDPMEELIASALEGGGYPFQRNVKCNGRDIDFYLPTRDVYIEVKQFHSHRAVEQMGAVDNIIVVQGEKAVRLLALALNDPNVWG